nr:retrovirus-related Pol polyprotein from transposon TNT 1-94 [Tanacetum cinerariifolium]
MLFKPGIDAEEAFDSIEVRRQLFVGLEKRYVMRVTSLQKSCCFIISTGNDHIACLNKAIVFMSTIMASRFLLTNNQLRTSSNPRNQATIQDDRVTIQQVQGDKGEGHMARQCTQPKRLRNSAWFKEKMLLVQAHKSGQTDSLDAYDSDCDDISSAKAILMANLSSYDLDVSSRKAKFAPFEQDIDSLKQTLFKHGFIDTYNETLEIKAQLAKKAHRVEKIVFNELVLRCSHLENRKNVVQKDALPKNSKVIAPRMFRLDLKLLAPSVLKNMDAYIDYIKHTQEHANILQELVKHARALRPLDIDLDSACNEDLGKLKPKADIEIFVGYAPTKKAYRIYNKKTRIIIETIHVDFDELTAMASKQFGSGLTLQLMTPRTISSGLVQNPLSPTPYVPPTKKDWDILLQPMFDEYFNPLPSVASLVHVVVVVEPTNPTGTSSSTFIDQDAPSPNNGPFFGVPILEPNFEESSSRDVIPSNVHSVNQPPEHLRK